MINNKLIKKCMDTLNDIKKDNILDTSLNSKIDRVIYEIECIERDKNIKVAILGEFSAGKSTFINALMRNKILSYADEPTTAINTYITYGEKDIVKVIKNNGKSKVISREDIEEFTKEGKRVIDLERVVIECNNEYLKNGLTIIDTPGANFDSNLHKKRRNDAINESVVGIFLIGANSLTSKSFIDFLKSNKDKMGKFIFVVNKCDILEDEDINIDFKNSDKIKSIYSYVRDNIMKNTGNKDIDIHMISSKCFLENKECNIINVKESFNRLENRIKEIYIKEKLDLIYWRIFNILKEINHEINETLKDKQAVAEYELNKANKDIKSINEFIDQEFNWLSNKFKSEVTKRQKLYYRDIETIKQRAKTRLFNNIRDINNVRDFKNNIRIIYNKQISYYLLGIEDRINESINEIINNNLDRVEENYCNYFENLKRVYINLGIERKQRIKEYLYYSLAIIIPFTLSSVIGKYIYGISIDLWEYVDWTVAAFFTSIICVLKLKTNIKKSKVIYNIKINNNIRDLKYQKINIPSLVNDGLAIRTSSGLGVGAVIGAFAGGPIGAAVGAGIGGLIGNFFESNELSKLKDEYSGYFNSELDKYDEEIKKYIDNVIDKKYNSLIDSYKLYAAENMILYSELIDGIYEFNTSKINRLIKTNNIFTYYLRKINSINREISKAVSKKSK